MSGPLNGLVIADFTQLAQGPFATQILGDLGAEIIKIEPPKGDWMRAFALANVYRGGESASFLSFNRNKRSVALDLKHPAGLEAARRLVGRADVVIENFRPGVMDRLGIGFASLAELNPRLVYVSSSGFGSTGPYVSRPGQDFLIQAMTGLPYLNGRRDDPPTAAGVGVADLTTGLHIVYATLAALYERDRTGKGQLVELNLYNSLLSLLTQELTTYLNGGPPIERPATPIPSPYLGAPYGMYQTADTYIAIAMNPLNQVAELVGVRGFADVSSKNVVENRDEVYLALAHAFRQKTTAQWLDILLPADIWCAPLYTFADVEKDPQVAENEMIQSFNHPTAGTVRTTGIAAKFRRTPGSIRRPPPQLGEHTNEILRELAGYSDEQVQEMKAAKAAF